MLNRGTLVSEYGRRGVLVSRRLSLGPDWSGKQTMDFTFKVLDLWLRKWTDGVPTTPDYLRNLRVAAAEQIALASFDAEADHIDRVLAGPGRQAVFRSTRPAMQKTTVNRAAIPNLNPDMVVAEAERTLYALGQLGLYSQPLHQACALLRTQHRLLAHYRGRGIQ